MNDLMQAPRQVEQETHTAYEWNEILKTGIVDYDGFRDGTITVDSKITRADFEQRAMHATKMVIRSAPPPVATPRTDAEREKYKDHRVKGDWVSTDFARTLERDLAARDAELARVTAERDILRNTLTFSENQTARSIGQNDDYAKILTARTKRLEDTKAQLAQARSGLEKIQSFLSDSAGRPFNDGTLYEQVVESRAEVERERRAVEAELETVKRERDKAERDRDLRSDTMENWKRHAGEHVKTIRDLCHSLTAAHQTIAELNCKLAKYEKK